MSPLSALYYLQPGPGKLINASLIIPSFVCILSFIEAEPGLYQGEIVIRQGDPGNMMYFVGNGILEVRLYYEGNHDAGGASNKRGSMKASEVPTTHSSAQEMNEQHNNTLDLVNAWRNVSMFGPSESYRKMGNLYAGEYFGEYSCLLGGS